MTRIRNANAISLEKLLVPYTKMNFGILKILKYEGFIDSFDIISKDSFPSLISIDLKFKKGLSQKPYITFLKRVSRPGLRVYVNSSNVMKIWGGIGIAVFV